VSAPRVLFVARTRYALPLDDTLRRRFDALSQVIEWRQLATSATGAAIRDDRFTLVPRFPVARLDGAVFYGLSPLRVAREIRSFRPDVVIVQGAEDTALALAARRLARSDVPVVLDVHGDWRTATRVYGSRARRLLAPLSDGLARVAVTHADGVRTVSAFTTGLVREQGVEPTAVFPAYMDLEPFLATPPAPLPDRPVALFVGVLERYKAVDVLAEAWSTVAVALPEAELHVVGRGSMAPLVEAMVDSGSGRVRWTPRLDTAGVSAALDAATLLVLPSRREGMGRVIVEAFCRGRAVVGTASGGIPDLVEDGRTGVLVPVDDPAALAEALSGLLGDPARASALGASARVASERWRATPAEFAQRTLELVETVIAAHGS
jgi:glycosyltransferase involved in cell wall biosynthesis